LSQVDINGFEKPREGDFLEVNLFKIQATPGYLEDVKYFLQHGQTLVGMTKAQR
jgi:hypothetical protein